MAVRYQQCLNLSQIQPVIQYMQVRIGGEIEKQWLIDQCLTSCPDILSSELSCILTGITAAEQSRPAFWCWSTIICDPHISFIPYDLLHNKRGKTWNNSLSTRLCCKKLWINCQRYCIHVLVSHREISIKLLRYITIWRIISLWIACFRHLFWYDYTYILYCLE